MMVEKHSTQSVFDSSRRMKYFKITVNKNKFSDKTQNAELTIFGVFSSHKLNGKSEADI